MADINIKFNSDAIGGDSSSNQYLVGILQKLNTTLEKLSNISRANPANAPIPTIKSTQDLDDAKRRYQQDSDKMLGEFRQIGNKIGSVIGTSVLTGIGVTAVRLANNYSNTIINRAGAQGTFAAAAIQGNASQSAGTYISRLYDIERARRIEQNSIIAQGVGGTGGAAAGAVGGGIAEFFSAAYRLRKGDIAGAFKNAGSSISGGAALGGALGYAGGTAYAATKNAAIERDFLIQSALAQRNFNASISQWKTGFSRFGLATTNTQIVPGDITGGAGISAPLATAFQSRYGSSQNFNAILNNIVPYLQANPLDRKNDLDKTAQNFRKAGFAVEDFSKLTILSTQYTATTGKNLQAFSEDIKNARVKFGDTFDLATLQTSLNLRSLGYNRNTAENIAYQAQFNPGIAGSVSRFSNQSFSDFYRNKALSSSFGFDINESLRTGQFAGGTDARRRQLTSAVNDYFEKGIMSAELGRITATGAFTPASLKSLLQNEAAITPNYKGQTGEAGLEPGQQLAQEVMSAITDGIKNVQNMTVTAQNVTISGALSQFTPANAITQAYRSIVPPPSAQVGGQSPAK